MWKIETLEYREIKNEIAVNFDFYDAHNSQPNCQ